MEVAFDRGVESLDAPATAYDDPADRQQGIGVIHLVRKLKGHDKPSFTQFGQRLGVPQTEGVCEVMYRGAGDGFELFGRFVDLYLPVFTLVFFYAMMIPGMAADDVAGGIEFLDLGYGHIMREFVQADGHDEEDAFEAVFLHFLPGYGVLVFVRVIEGEHDRLAGERRALGEVGV